MGYTRAEDIFYVSDARRARPADSEAVVVVDLFSSGALIAAGLAARGFRVLRVFSEMDSPVSGLCKTASQQPLTPRFNLTPNG